MPNKTVLVHLLLLLLLVRAWYPIKPLGINNGHTDKASRRYMRVSEITFSPEMKKMINTT